MIEKKSVFDLHTHIFILITAVAILQMNFLGTFGLMVYGMLYTYSFLTLLANRKKLPYFKNWLLVVLAAYYIHYVVCITINGLFIVSFTTLLQFFLFSLCCYYIRDIDEIERDYVPVSKALTVACLFMGTVSVSLGYIAMNCPGLMASLPQNVQDFIISRSWAGYNHRLVGLVGSPNTSASYCAVCGMFSMYLLLRKGTSWAWRVAAVANMVLSFCVIILGTGSRTSMLTYIAFLAAYTCLYVFVIDRDNRYARMVFCILLTIAIAAVAFLAFQIVNGTAIGNYFLDHVIRKESLSTGSGRLRLYRIAYELGKGHRIFGISNVPLIEATGDPNATNGHNLLLHALTFTGIPGLVFMVVYMGWSTIVAVRNVFKAKDQATLMLCCFNLSYLFAYYVNGITEYGSLDHMRMISLCSQFVFAYGHIISFQLGRSGKE